MKIEHKSFVYTVLDAFTKAQYSGNQLAVIKADKGLGRKEDENLSRESVIPNRNAWDRPQFIG